MVTVTLFRSLQIKKIARKAILHIALLIIILLVALVMPASVVLAAAPTITTDAATNETESTAVLNGTLSDLGTITNDTVYLYYQYCTEDYWAANSAYSDETPEQAWLTASGPTTYSAELSGLLNSTDYLYRAALRYGTSYVYGTPLGFNTNMLPPDSVPSISLFQAYQDLIEADDALFLILADIPYQDLPSIPVNRAYKWSLIHNVTEVGWNVGYSMNDLGYNLNLYALYFTAADAIDWGNVVDYSLELSGSGAVFHGDIPVYDELDDPFYTVTSDTWVASSDYTVRLAKDLLDIMSILEQEWQIILLDEQDSQTVLSSNGEKLLRNTIPGVQAMAPAIFYVQNVLTDVTERSWSTSLDTTYQERLLGVDGLPGGGDDVWVATSLLGLADWINVPWLLMLGMICVGVCVYVIHKSTQKYATPVPGYVGSLIVVMCFGILALGLTVVAIIAFVLVLAGGWLIFMRKA
jgi:hypothetical protein